MLIKKQSELLEKNKKNDAAIQRVGQTNSSGHDWSSPCSEDKGNAKSCEDSTAYEVN